MEDTMTKALRACNTINTFWDQLTVEAKRMIEGNDLQSMALLDGMDVTDLNRLARELALLDVLEVE